MAAGDGCGCGSGRWLQVMAAGDGSGRWLQVMAAGDGSGRWQRAMAAGAGAHNKAPAEYCRGYRRSNCAGHRYRDDTHHTKAIMPKDHNISVRSRSVYSDHEPTKEHATHTGMAMQAIKAKHRVIILPPPALKA